MNRIVICHAKIHNFEFPQKDIEDAVQSGRLLSMELELGLHCDFQCPYCSLQERPSSDNELSLEEIYDAILQAKSLGARKISLSGGEPTLYPDIWRVIAFIRSNDLQVEMFTNGSLITFDFSRELMKRNVKVVLKMDSLEEKTQDMLAGKKGAFRTIQQAFHNLKEAGYPSEDDLLAVSTVICSQNIDELASMWLWLTEQRILLYSKTVLPQRGDKESEWLYVDSRRLHALFVEITEICRNRFGQNDVLQPLSGGSRCLRHLFSCLVTSRGDVMPCVGVDISIGNIRERELGSILLDSEVIENLRDYRRRIKGPCQDCDEADHCYGCRGAAFQLTGDYLASDPLCWRNIDRQEEILRLPVSVDGFLPQKAPMRVVDTLVKIGDRKAEVTTTVSEDMIFVGDDGILDEVVYLELLAQAIASEGSFNQTGTSQSGLQGLLLGAKKLEILGPARVGDTLNISVYKYGRFGDFGIVKGEICRDNTVIARGEIKIWHSTEENTPSFETAGGGNTKQ